MLSGNFSAFAPVASASRTTSLESAARKAAPRYLERDPADYHARCAGIGPAQLELIGGAADGGEPERVREPFRGGEVGLAELQPGQIEHLDDGVLGTSRVLTGQPALLAVQVVVGPVVTGHLCS